MVIKIKDTLYLVGTDLNCLSSYKKTYSNEQSLNFVIPIIIILFLGIIWKILLLPDSTKSKLKISEIILKGTIMGAIVTIPSIIAFLITLIVLDNLITAIIVGAIVHFIAMGFSLKISKTILIKK